MPDSKYISQKIIEKTKFLQEINIFHGRQAPEKGTLVGYGAVIEALGLSMPLPDILAFISEKRRQYKTADWIVFTPRHKPQDSLYSHLVFSMKYEGINLLFFKKLFEILNESVIEELVRNEPLSQYSRRIWFLFEWLIQKKLNISNLKEGNYVPVLDGNLQYTSGKGVNSPRHRVRNNLPGTINFCPLINKTEKLETYINADLANRTIGLIRSVHKDILLRASAFLMLRDSKASFNIEGETPTNRRAMLWGKVIGQAGNKPLSRQEFLRLQQSVIQNNRFIKMGFRTEGGFVGVHDRNTGEPIPEHISARWQDLETLINGLVETCNLTEKSHFHPVLTATIIAFGFVFIHPFNDGNGRIHRYLINHILAKMKFTPQGIIFPVSVAILEKIDDYREILEAYSHPLLDFIDWKITKGNNIEVINETGDYYRYFDATVHAEFLFDCIDYTINKIIPEEVSYLQNYDKMKAWLDNEFEMPDKMVSKLIGSLDQNNGKLSKRTRTKEFEELNDEEVQFIEQKYQQFFGS